MNESKISRIVNQLKNKEKIRVLFVCLGNICRSPAAEGVLKAIVAEHGDQARWGIDSAGLTRVLLMPETNKKENIMGIIPAYLRLSR